VYIVVCDTCTVVIVLSCEKYHLGGSSTLIEASRGWGHLRGKRNVLSSPSGVWGQALSAHGLFVYVWQRNTFYNTKCLCLGIMKMREICNFDLFWRNKIGILHANYCGGRRWMSFKSKILGGGSSPSCPTKLVPTTVVSVVIPCEWQSQLSSLL